MKLVIELIVIILGIYKFVLFASVIFSWLYVFNVINTRNQFVAMVGDFLYRVTEPVLRPIRRFLPQLGGLDLSPIALFLAIWFVQEFLMRYVYPYMPF